MPIVFWSTPDTLDIRFARYDSILLSVCSDFVSVLLPVPGSPTTNVLTTCGAGHFGHFEGRSVLHSW